MSYNNPIESIENDILVIAISSPDGSYVLWQKSLHKGPADTDEIYFEFDDQNNGGYNIVKECTVTNDGIHVVLSNGKLNHFYFPPGFDKYDELKIGLNKIYSNKSGILEFQI